MDMDTHALDTSPEVAPARAIARERVLETVRAYRRGTEVAPLYLAAGSAGEATTLLAMAATEVRSAGRGERPLICTGADFAALWRDTLRRGMTPFVRHALAARQAILLEGLEALRGEPFAQRELARLIAPERLIVLAGRDHPPRVADADAWAIVDQVARYYGFTRAQLLSRRRTAPLALARQVAMRLLRQEGLTASRVGHLLRRDHSTVLHGDARVRRLVAREAPIRHDLATLRRSAGAA